MAFKNIARYGYQQTVAGAWYVGAGTVLRFHISDPRAERFRFEIFGPTSQQMRDDAVQRQRIAAGLGVSLSGPSTTDVRPVNVGAGGGLALMILNMINTAASFHVSHKPWTRINRSAFALGAPIYHGDRIQDERSRERIREALRHRGTRGLGNLTWVDRHYRSLIDSGPYFIENGGRRWWESGLIVIPQSREAAVGSSATIATDVILRVRTDLAGRELYLELTATDNHQPLFTRSGVFTRPGPLPSIPDSEVHTIEQWE